MCRRDWSSVKVKDRTREVEDPARPALSRSGRLPFRLAFSSATDGLTSCSESLLATANNNNKQPQTSRQTMGTLTAGQPRLPHYCEHKLPTSCRLSSIGECCACYDERAHSTSYSTYIDGVGFVSRGVRWQRYCWFCKEFWEKRCEVSGLRPSQTRIPEVPSQSEFLHRWYEFHQGFRIVTKDDGTEERVAVLGEDFRDVAPGCLPRTLDELRAGRERSEMEDRERQINQSNAAQEQPVDTGPSLEETLDQLLETAADEQPSVRLVATPQSTAPPPQDASTSVHAQAMAAAGTRNRETQMRRIRALISELHRMRNGIQRVMNELRDLGQGVPDHEQTTNHLSEIGRNLDSVSGPLSEEDAQRAINSVNTLTENVAATQTDRTLANFQARVDEARSLVEEARRRRDRVAAELNTSENDFNASQARLRQVQTEQRTTENYMRLFGTREEMIEQGENYESPIGGMFSRAMERFRAAEEVRREERTLRQVLEDEERGGETAATRLAELGSQERDVWGVPRPLEPSTRRDGLQQIAITNYMTPHEPSPRPTTQGRFGTPQTDADLRGDEVGLEEYYTLLRRQNWSQEAQDQLNTGATELPTNEFEFDTWPTANSGSGNQGRFERNTALAGMIAEATSTSSATEAGVADPNIVAGPPGQQLDDDPYVSNDRGRDAVFVLTALSNSDFLRRLLPWNPSANVINRLLRNSENNLLGWADRENIESILDDQNIVWMTRLPAERNRRRRARGERVTFNPNAVEMARSESVTIVHDLEIMAECFQMSSQIRRQSGQTPMEQLAMLYRLQRGERSGDDRVVLARMLHTESILTRAGDIHAQHNQLNQESTARLADYERNRQEVARQGDHSPAELDSQRRATRRDALAAGRAAMSIGPAALLARMADRDEQTRAAYERLQQSAFNSGERRPPGSFYRQLSLGDFNASPSDSDESEDGGRGLDAKDSGRPEEPLTEEEMTVVLDCRICYSQKANICTIPCGHLAMCQWCSEQHSPTMAHDRTRPRRAANCPVCRKHIRQKVKVVRS